MGSLGDLVGMIPGLKKVAGQVDSEESKRELVRIQAIIDSMTMQERENHLVLNGKRRARIATGSGTSVQDVNRFLKQFEQTRKVMKKLTRIGPGHDARHGPREIEYCKESLSLMALVIRLRRHGSRKKPFFRIVVADSRSPRDGRFVEQIGTYDPAFKPPRSTAKGTGGAMDWIRREAFRDGAETDVASSQHCLTPRSRSQL